MQNSNTNWNLYRSFITVFETKNIQHAANLLSISRPAVGQNLKELSKQLGIKLFLPNRRGVEPTYEATELYNEIAPAFNQIMHAEENLSEFNESSSGLIRIAITTSNFGGFYLAEKIIAFREKFPNIKFDIINKSVEEALKMLEKNEVQMIVSILPKDKVDEYGFNQIPIESYSQSFFTTKKFAEKHNIGKIISKEKFMELPLVAMRTVFHFVDGVKTPDILIDAQETGLRLIPKDIAIHFGIPAVVNEALKNIEIVTFDVEGISPKQAVLVCAYPAKKLLSKAASAFLPFLKSNI